MHACSRRWSCGVCVRVCVFRVRADPRFLTRGGSPSTTTVAELNSALHVPPSGHWAACKVVSLAGPWLA